jgi:23S rRNA (uracil1939-C5)-methyltransferase
MVALGEEEKVYYGPGTITEKLGKFTFRLSANSFFQTNSEQAERMYDRVRELANLQPDDVLYDLYCGTGAIAIYLSPFVKRVLGIELTASAVRDAEQNAEVNHVRNCSFLEGDLKEKLTNDSAWNRDHPSPTVIVTDPPRSGMHPKVVERIIKLSPERIVYVSCNPATQARDAKQMSDGGYTLKEVQPIDMFPHTDHIEAVALFTKR